jgi:hypothetical protein
MNRTNLFLGRGRLVIVLAVFLAPALRATQVSYVVHMSLDGLGAKYLQFFVTNAPANFSNFNRLVVEGASTFNARCDYHYSETVPNHLTMLTGRPVLQPTNAPNTTHHGYSDNFPSTEANSPETIHNTGNTNVPYKASFFDVAHDYGLTTALIIGKSRLQICARSYNTNNGAADAVPEGGDNGPAKIDYVNLSSTGVDSLLAQITNSTPKNYSFIHLTEPDTTGHMFGWRSSFYSNMVSMIDGQVGRIMNAINASPILSNRTAFIITADHGGGGLNATTHAEAAYLTNYTIPFFLWGAGTPANRDIYSLFSNRGNPGTNRTDYSAVPQPVRNADSGNLALNLLGLPPIPGSFSVPIFGATNNIALGTNGTHTLWWAGEASAFVLECTPTVGPSQWQAISNGVVNNGGMWVYAVTNLGTQFYRLRKL